MGLIKWGDLNEYFVPGRPRNGLSYPVRVEIIIYCFQYSDQID